MLAIVSIQTLANVAIVLCAVGATEPFTLDIFHALITQSGNMREGAQVCYREPIVLVVVRNAGSLSYPLDRTSSQDHEEGQPVLYT